MSLREELSCQECEGKGYVYYTYKSGEGAEISTTKPCPDCVEGIPRQWIETVAHSLHQHGDRLDVYGNMKPQTERWQDCGGADAHKGAAVDLLVALRDREETE